MISDAYAIALTMLSRGELSTAQLRDRLRRKGLAHDQIDRALHRLLSEGALNDRRAAVSYARHAALIKLRVGFVRPRSSKHAGSERPMPARPSLRFLANSTSKFFSNGP